MFEIALAILLAVSISNHTITSEDPKLAIDVDASLKFVGIFEANLRDSARYERVVFADVDAGGNIQRMWIAQFERMLPSHSGSYAPGAGTAVRIGPITFTQQVGRYSFPKSIASKPGGEAERTRQFLTDRHLHLPDDLTVARFEAHTDVKNRSELLIFYWERDAETNNFADKAIKMFRVR